MKTRPDSHSERNTTQGPREVHHRSAKEGEPAKTAERCRAKPGQGSETRSSANLSYRTLPRRLAAERISSAAGAAEKTSNSEKASCGPCLLLRLVRHLPPQSRV